LPKVTTTTLRKADGTLVCARCTIADTARARMKGLLGRSSLDPDEGILLTPGGSVHMFFMRFAIDAVFCDRDLNVIDVARDLRPWRVAGRRGAKTVIELAAGAAADVRSGDRLVLGTIDP
jgi:uncharacterized protein